MILTSTKKFPKMKRNRQYKKDWPIANSKIKCLTGKIKKNQRKKYYSVGGETKMAA